jgi:hypothetical protein
MPRNVRNFWMKAKIDGRRTDPSGFGPQAKNGGFVVDVFQRNDGAVVRAGQLQGFAHSDGRLVLCWWDSGSGEQRTLFETARGGR